MNVDDLVARKSLIVCVGPGGVGKTTVSAALGLAGARAGRRTVVLTIDPARRLADALGLPGLDDEIRPVPLHDLPELATITGQLDAAMVDTAQSYDALIRRIAPDPDTLDRILDNRVFQAMSRALARSHAYVAMERVYDAMENHRYDLVVLDTPPARNALEILDAPAQLAKFLDAKIIEWFLPGDGPKGIRDRILASGGQVAKSLLGLVTGEKLLREILSFLALFAVLREGFLQRSRTVEQRLRADETGYVLVSSASPASADDAAWLRHDLERRNVRVDAVVFNQSYVPLDPRRPDRIVTALVGRDIEPKWQRLAPHLLPGLASRTTLERLRELRCEAAEENARFQAIVDGLAAELPRETQRVRTPRFAEEIRDLPGLLALVRYLAPPKR